MGVSPITVREALNTLRVKGLIDTRRGKMVEVLFVSYLRIYF